MRNLRRIWQEERVLLWLRWKSCYEEQKERRMGKEKAETGRERKKGRESERERESDGEAQQPKSKMQIYSTNHYRRQASLLLKKRKEKPVYGPPVRGFGGNPRSPEGEFTPHAVNAC